MEAMTGFFSAQRLISCHMRSEARASPPGLSTLSTTASTFLSFLTFLSWLITCNCWLDSALPHKADSSLSGCRAMKLKLIYPACRWLAAW